MALSLISLMLCAAPVGDRAQTWLDSLREVGHDTSATIQPRSQTVKGAKGDIREVYRKVAPATVLIRTPNGFGTGVIIDPRGFVLTNHHVIAGGELVDFKRKVTVELGHLTDAGIMEKDGKVHTAWVLKSDPLVDLAVIKIDDPPAELPVLKVAEKDPVPGEPVSALGNGGIGLLWAIKDGEIASIGRMATHLAMLVGAECQVSTDAAAMKACQASRAGLEAEKKQFAEQVPGLVIQSSCPISPGDSGGPLVNRQGELVGLNAFLRTDTYTPVAASFHVHVDEVRKFLREVPAEAKPRLPLPWEGLKAPAQLLDADADGVKESLVASSADRTVVLMDLDQDSKDLPATAEEVLLKHALKADLAVTRIGERSIAFYDRNGDGVFDQAAVSLNGADDAETWSVAPDGTLTRLGKGKLIDASLLKKEHAARLTSVAPVALTELGFTLPVDLASLPDPWQAGGTRPSLKDDDFDGKFDRIEAASMSAWVSWMDPAEAYYPALTAADAANGLKERTLKGRLAYVERGSRVWAFIDSDNDGKLDAVLATDDPITGVATRAFTLDDKGKSAGERPELLGVMLGAPLSGLDDKARDRLMVSERYARLPWRASGRGQAGMPHPILDVGTDVLYEVGPSGYGAISVLGGTSDRASSLLFDLRADPKKPRKVAEIEKHARAGDFNAAFAWVSKGRAQWFFYDLDGKPGFDYVVFVDDGQTLSLSFDAWHWKVDASAAGKKAVRPSLFKDPKVSAALKTVAGTYFVRSLVEQ